MKEIYIGSKIYPFEETLIMGILNVTPDSFYDGGKYVDNKAISDRIKSMLDSGADIIDIGGESTRPGYQKIDIKEELNRIMPALKLAKSLNATVSVDTSKAEVAKQVLEEGTDMINDISGVTDPKIAELVSAHNASLCIMHNTPLGSNDIIEEIKADLISRASFAESFGIKKEQIFLDTGIGFNKDLKQNLFILKNLAQFKDIGYPTLLGASRKSVIYKTLNTDPSGALVGTLAVTSLAYSAGVNILRVHDASENKEFLKMLKEVKNV